MYFTIKRLGFSLITIWLVVTITFVLLQFLPGDPFTNDKMIHPQILENLKEKYHLDDSLLERYTSYLKGLIRGDLGISMVYRNRSVNSIIKSTFPVSLNLGIRAFIIAVFVGLALGLLSAAYKNKPIDHFVLTISMIGVAVPGFIIGTLFQYFICYKLSEIIQQFTGTTLRFFPVTGWEGFRYTVIPSVSLAFGALGMIARMMRESMIKTLSQRYIISAKSKGLNHSEIILRHAFKNAILPVISLLGPLFTSIILGSFAIENIFSIPGMGQHLVTSIKTGDYTMVMGLSVFTSFIVVIVNTLTDILYTFVDPRVRL